MSSTTAYRASAAIEYWDVGYSHTGAGAGGTGTWDTTSPSWYQSGSTDTTWAGDSAFFAGTAGTVNVINTGVSANEVIFETTGYTIAGTGSITLTGPGVVGFIGSTTQSQTITTPLTGTAGLTLQSGAGGTVLTATLTGANDYTGTTTVNGAALVLGNTNASAATIINGGNLTLNFGLATAPVSNIMNSASSLTTGYATTFNMTSKAGTANSQGFTGGLTVDAGVSTLTIVNGSAASSAVVNLGGITRTIGGTANFVEPTANTTISATNGYTTTTLNDAVGLLGAGLTVGGSGGTDWAFNNGTNIIALPAANYMQQNSVASWGANQNITNSAAYSGTLGANLTIGSLRLNYAGASNINAGGNNLTVTDGILVTSTVGANASTISNGSLFGASGKDLVIIQNNTNAAGALTISASIADNGSATALTKSGLGILTLSGSNSYTGGTFHNAGILNLNNNNAIGTGPLTILNGATIDNTSGSPVTLTSTSPVVLGTPGSNSTITYAGSNGGVLSLGAGGVTLEYATPYSNLASSGNSLTLTVNGGTLNFLGAVSPTTTGYFNSIILKNGPGVLALMGADSFTIASAPATNGRILLRGGTLALDNPLALGAGGIATNSATSSLDNTSSGPITLSNNPGLTLGFATLGFTGTQSLNYGTGAVTMSQSTTITTTANTLTLGGIVGGAFGLTKAGAGSLVLGGANTYSLGTTVSNGTLVANNTTGSGLGTGSVTVSGGTLAGTGTFSGDLHIQSGGTLSPGIAGAGTLTNTSTNAADLSAGVLTITLGSSATQLTDLRVSGGVTLGGTLTLLDSGSAPVGTVFRIIDNTGTSAISTAFAGLSSGSTVSDANGSQYTISYAGGTGNDVTLTETSEAVPEPATISSLVLGGLLLRRTRRKPI